MPLTIPRPVLLQAAEDFGLPLYVYDAGVITRQVRQLREAFHLPRLEIRYACKALHTIGVLRHLLAEGCGMDTVSPNEAIAAQRAGANARDISFTPNGVRLDEYDWAIRAGYRVHIDRLDVLTWIANHHPGAAVTLRFNPGIQAGGHEKLQVGISGSKFGFPANEVGELIRLIRDSTLRVNGVHMHLGSDIENTAQFLDALEFLLGLAGHFTDGLEHVDIGGGFKVRYHPADPVFDMQAFGKAVSDRFARFCSAVGRPITLVLEPGKYLVSEAGYLLLQVTSVRERQPASMAWVQSGFNHFLRPMYYGAYHHFLHLNRPEGPERCYDIVGYLCETDTFATGRWLPELRAGDILCLCSAGAYGITMASQYNLRPRPAECLYSGDAVSLIRRRETTDDLLATDLGY